LLFVVENPRDHNVIQAGCFICAESTRDLLDSLRSEGGLSVDVDHFVLLSKDFPILLGVLPSNRDGVAELGLPASELTKDLADLLGFYSATEHFVQFC
jgi:hypothetical protein